MEMKKAKLWLLILLLSYDKHVIFVILMTLHWSYLVNIDPCPYTPSSWISDPADSSGISMYQGQRPAMFLGKTYFAAQELTPNFWIHRPKYMSCRGTTYRKVAFPRSLDSFCFISQPDLALLAYTAKIILVWRLTTTARYRWRRQVSFSLRDVFGALDSPLNILACWLSFSNVTTAHHHILFF